VIVVRRSTARPWRPACRRQTSQILVELRALIVGAAPKAVKHLPSTRCARGHMPKRGGTPRRLVAASVAQSKEPPTIFARRYCHLKSGETLGGYTENYWIAADRECCFWNGSFGAWLKLSAAQQSSCSLARRQCRRGRPNLCVSAPGLRAHHRFSWPRLPARSGPHGRSG